jgi:two-component system, NtrC family, response regulator PilR
MKSQVLCICGNRDDGRKLAKMLDTLPVVLEHARTLAQARSRLRNNNFDVVLTDSAFPGGTWLDVLHLVREVPFEIRVIVTDPQADARFWAEALNLGAYDLLTQPFEEHEVQRIVQNACARVATAGAAFY